MINKQELRIGNIVYNNLGTRHEPIHNYLLLDSLNYDMRVLDPIPLTEDILLKCAKFYEEDSMGSKWFGINIGGEHYGVIELLPDGRVLYDGGFIQYLHEFQNAFYWGKNRKIELKVEL